MAVPDPTHSRIVAAWRQASPRSAALAAEAATLLPSGITHDARHVEPYGPYIARAQGAHKWDVDGRRYIDFFGGHGALILGHAHPAVTAAVAAALPEGTQFGANHPREIAWARAIQRLVPAAERIRFTSSGTEATLLAVRLARAFTGRPVLLRLAGHFHGWHDQMTSGYTSHFDGTATPGVLEAVAAASPLLPPGDLDAVEAVLRKRRDVAALIYEPTGCSFGQVPLDAAYAQGLRDLTNKYGVLLIFDEVITGFRVARGGAAEAFGVTPDLVTFAKIVSGGLPGAAVAGRREILDQIDFAAMEAAGREKISHPGTFNANPLSAAAGIACLTILAETDANDVANARATRLRAGLNAMLAEEGLKWAVYGSFSGFHLFTNPQGRPEINPLAFDAMRIPMAELKGADKALVNRLRLALYLNGVDPNPRLGGFTSAAHSETDITQTIAAYRAAIGLLRAEGEIAA